ncbi:hypothetical protein [uncultured Sphingomonas sp.]|uniref:hypothetical protein n=1 Tax=uncultured Sphingomonas sp. TaxID=158754 RepID=UPI0025F550D9|nr:hypothetical protein [uncultured Sphingomonas sp.]
MAPRVRLRPAARIARAQAEAARIEQSQRRAAIDEAIMTALASAKLPITTVDLASMTGLTRAAVDRRLRVLRAAARVRWVPGTTWAAGWALPRDYAAGTPAGVTAPMDRA